MFTVIFTQAARAELIDAQDWYEREAVGLGRHFREAMGALARWAPLEGEGSADFI